MPRDYAKKSSNKPKRRNATRRAKQGFPTAAVLVVGMILGGFIGFLIYLKWIPTKNDEKQPTTAAQKSENKSLAKVEPQPKVPKYTFHDILEDKEVVIPEEDLKRPENVVSMEYIMPCGSFRNNDIADALKAKIAFLGYESSIMQVDAESGRWYRVQLGPFASKRQAESIRHRLQENEINDCKIWGKKL